MHRESPPDRAVAVIGECMLQLDGVAFGTLRQSYGGDTLNTALYLTRLAGPSLGVKYVTAVGNDHLSETMLRAWREEGIDTDLVLRDATRLPGLYQIQTDSRGERRFSYWRSDSAARYLLQHPDIERVRRALQTVELIYISGISLAILPVRDRDRLTDILVSAATQGVTIAVDTNYRPSLWASVTEARDCITRLLPITRVLFATFDDERQLWDDSTPQTTLSRYRDANIPTVVIKLGPAGCLHSDGTTETLVPAAPVDRVVDTTSAGDSFNAGWLAASLTGADAVSCCRTGNALAGIVIQHPGAIIPASATPSLQALGRVIQVRGATTR